MRFMRASCVSRSSSARRRSGVMGASPVSWAAIRGDCQHEGRGRREVRGQPVAPAGPALHNHAHGLTPGPLTHEATMRWTGWLIACVLPMVAFLSVPPQAQEVKRTTNVSWKKTVLDRAFRSEGVTVADVNKDGKMDIVNGEVWFEAPDWKMHEIRKSKDHTQGEK